jgi:hypothetical protein
MALMMLPMRHLRQSARVVGIGVASQARGKIAEVAWRIVAWKSPSGLALGGSTRSVFLLPVLSILWGWCPLFPSTALTHGLLGGMATR